MESGGNSTSESDGESTAAALNAGPSPTPGELTPADANSTPCAQIP